MRAFTYVIMTDRGSAPNYDGACVTLAICKPRVRLGAEVGDLVLAFSGKTLNPEPHSVCWAGVVSEKLTFAEYWNDPRFKDKRPDQSYAIGDNIYRPARTGLEQVPNGSHDQDGAVTDLSGKFVLCFSPSWVFREAAPILPAEFGLRMTSSRRGHHIHQVSDASWKQLRSWLTKSLPARSSARASSSGTCASARAAGSGPKNSRARSGC